METFFTTSDKIQHIIKSFNLTKTLFVSSIIIGDMHTGKKTLAKYLFPNAPLVSGKNKGEVELALETYDELIIIDFEKLTNHNNLDFSNKRIIATANYISNPEIIDDKFAFIYQIPSLIERPDDVKHLKNIFIEDALSILMLDKNTIEEESIPINLSLNSKSLKKSIFTHLMKQSVDRKDIQDILYTYLIENLSGNDGYREHIGLYEEPLIKAGLKKYGSQLQLAEVLGINRNTLRKKIHEHNIN